MNIPDHEHAADGGAHNRVEQRAVKHVANGELTYTLPDRHSRKRADCKQSRAENRFGTKYRIDTRGETASGAYGYNFRSALGVAPQIAALTAGNNAPTCLRLRGFVI